MATRKRTSSRSGRSGLVGRAVKAGRNALRQAESRVPPDLRRQLERTIKDGQKTLMTAIDQLETRVRRSATQADLDKVFKRLEGLSKQVQQMARGASSRAAARTSSTTRRAASTTRRAAGTAKRTARRVSTRKPATQTPSARRSSSGGSTSSTGAAKRTTTRRSSARRSAAASPESSSPAQTTHEPQWMPESSDMGGTSS